MMREAGERFAVRGLCAGYDHVPVLADIWLTAGAGEAVAIHGDNGSGKSTLARTIAGLERTRAGETFLDGRSIELLLPWQRASLGLRLVPQGERVFQDLTVQQNVRLLSGHRAADMTSHDLIMRAEWLREMWRRPAGNLSGGRQALLALLATVLARPKLLLLDEPAAELDDEMLNVAARLVRDICRQGAAVVIFEHRQAFSRLVTERGLYLENGRLH